LGLHSAAMFDNRLGDEALYGAGCEVVDTVLDIPSLMQFVDGRRGPPTREYKAIDVAKAFHVKGWLGRSREALVRRSRAGAVATNLVRVWI
jgi:hypothetical protein